jgi:hypothetical protein
MIDDAVVRLIAEVDRYIGYYQPYATIHDSLDADEAVQEEIRNTARATRGCEGEESRVSDACRPRIAGAAEEVTGRRQAQARRQKHDPLGMLSHVSTRSNRFRIRQRDHAGDNEGAEARAEDELARDKNTIVIQQGLDHWRSGRLWLLGSAPSNAFRGGMFRVLPTKPFAGCRQSMQSR